MLCPCGSGRYLADCCGPYLEGLPAPDAELLMRSRYCAYVLKRHDYLLITWHASTRPEEGSLGGTTLAWIGLEIMDSTTDGESAAEVEFLASYVDCGKGRRLHELSRFVREDGHWLYVDGDCRIGEIGRNDVCPCGSGRKFKRCCAGRA